MLSLKPGNSVKLNESMTDIHMPIHAEWKIPNSHHLKGTQRDISKGLMKPVFSTQTAQKDFDVKSVSLFQLGSVQQRCNTAAPRLLSLQRPAFKVGPSLLSGRVTDKLYLDDKWLTMPELLTQILFIPNTSFPSRSLEFCYLLGWGGLCDQIPTKTVGAKPPMCHYNMQLEKFSTFCLCLYLERTLRSSVSEFHPLLYLCWFSFVSFLL